MQFIDPHIHLFDLTLGQYQWLKPENPPFWPDKHIINKNFSEADINLLGDLNSPELSGFVHIEAGFDNQAPWREIQWLELNCKKLFKSVACVDLTLSPNSFLTQLKTLLSYESVVGCRHILDDAAVDILNHPNTPTNLKALAEHQLSFDLQMPLSDLNSIDKLTQLLAQLPELTVIINHAGFPPYFIKTPIALDSSEEYSNWLTGLKTLAQFKQCAIKCSGWEMLNRSYSTLWCKLVIEQCITTFGINRVMLSSNFPLCLFSKSYQVLWQYQTQLSKYNPQELAKLCLENTKHWYNF